MKFDDILLQIGEFGPYQKRVFYLFCLPILIAGAQVFSVIFTYDIPSRRCALPGFRNDTFKIQNEAHALLVNQSIPPPGDDDDGVYSGCLLYSNTNSTYAGNSSQKQECDRWVYDKTDYINTISTEFDLVCGKEIMRSHANMIAFSGSFCGSLMMGIFADIFGRKKAIVLALLFQIVSSLVIFLSQSIYVIMGARFLGGIATHAMFAIPATTGIELLGPNKRSFAGVIVEVAWVVGLTLLLPAAYALQRWRYIQLVIVLSSLPLLSFWWIVPESPRWLLDKNRLKEVEVIMRKICKSNKCELPVGVINADTKDEGPQLKFWVMFTHKTLVIRSLIIFFNWFAVNLLYYGLTLNTANLEGSPYLNYLFGAVVEILSYVFCLPIIDRVARRKLHCVCMYMGSLACLAIIPTIIWLDGNPWVTVAISMVGKFCSSFCYTILYIMSAEQFPTNIRNSAIGFCSIFESLGGMLSPYIADLGLLVGGKLGKGIPLIIFGGLSFLAGGLSLILPETLHQKLPETVEDVIALGKRKVPSLETKDDQEMVALSHYKETDQNL